MRLVNKGSYGKIYDNGENVNGTIVKEICLFKNNTICSSTLRELNMYGLLSSNKSNNNIIKTTDIHFKKDKVYLTMENGGKTLSVWLQENSQTVPHNFLNIFKGIINALYHINNLGYVHGDIKPDNIVIGKNMEPKLIDFGASIPYGKITSYCMCTKLFRDPLLSDNNCVYNEKSDIFSLALVLGYIVSSKYFINENNEYNYIYFCETINGVSYLSEEMKKIIISMGNVSFDIRPTYQKIINFLDIENIGNENIGNENIGNELEDENKENKENKDIPPYVKNYISNALRRLDFEEYIEPSLQTFKKLYDIDINYSSKLYISIIFILKIIYFDRMNIYVQNINNFFPLPYTIGEIKNSIIDIIVKLNLKIY